MHGAARAVGRKAAVLCNTARREPAREAKGRRGDVRKVLTLWQVGERDMREGAAGLRGGAFCGRGEHLCRGRPALEVADRGRWRRR